MRYNVASIRTTQPLQAHRALPQGSTTHYYQQGGEANREGYLYARFGNVSVSLVPGDWEYAGGHTMLMLLCEAAAVGKGEGDRIQPGTWRYLGKDGDVAWKVEGRTLVLQRSQWAYAEPQVKGELEEARANLGGHKLHTGLPPKGRGIRRIRLVDACYMPPHHGHPDLVFSAGTEMVLASNGEQWAPEGTQLGGQCFSGDYLWPGARWWVVEQEAVQVEARGRVGCVKRRRGITI